MRSDVVTSIPRFRYESDLVEPLRPSLARLMFARTSLPEVEVFSEVPAVHGIPDLAAVRFDWAAVERRRAAGVRPLSTDVEVRAAVALRRRKMSTRELAHSHQMSPDYVRRAVIPLLEQKGWARRGQDGELEAIETAVPVMRRVVTVEAKLRDWHRAVAQARRQQFSSDTAYIALEASAVARHADELRYVAKSGIGVISVDPESRTSSIWAHPVRRFSPRQTLVGRMLVTERCLDMWLRGEREGQIYPVYGWTLPESGIRS